MGGLCLNPNSLTKPSLTCTPIAGLNTDPAEGDQLQTKTLNVTVIQTLPYFVNKI